MTRFGGFLFALELEEISLISRFYQLPSEQEPYKQITL